VSETDSRFSSGYLKTILPRKQRLIMPRRHRAQKSHDRRLAPPLSISQILAWADDFQARRGIWPRANSGRIPGALGTTWCAVDAALRNRFRGLSVTSSLSKLLQAERNVRHRLDLPPLRIARILQWGDAYFAKTGRWPGESSGPIPASGGESWRTVEDALRDGTRGLPGNSSLPRLFAALRGRRNHMALSPLRIRDILAWADRHFRSTGRWPKHNTGLVSAAPHETWSGVNMALWHGLRGLPGGSSLIQLLMQHRGLRSCGYRPPLKPAQIRTWARDYRRQHGRWPSKTAGPILDTDGETWTAVAMALKKGNRGLPGGTTLRQFLTSCRTGKRKHGRSG